MRLAGVIVAAALLTSCWWRPRAGGEPGGWRWHREITPGRAEAIACTREHAFVRHAHGVVRWDGAAWSPWAHRDERMQGSSIAATPSGHLFLGAGHAIAEWSGSEWIDRPVASWAGPIVAPGAREAYSIGRGHIARFDGERWTEHEAGTWVELRAAAIAGDDLLVAGQGGTIMRFHDGAWSREATEVTMPVDALAAFAEDDVWATAWSWGNGDEPSGGTTLHYDGSSWSRYDRGVHDSLVAIGGAPGDVYAVSRRVLLRFEGDGWCRVAGTDGDGLPSPQGFVGVCATDRHVLVLDAAGHALVRAR